MQDRIREARKRMGFSQGELAKMIHTSTAYISLIESGKRRISPEQLATLAVSLGVREEWLATGEGDMTDHEATRDRRSIGERLLQVRKEKKMNQAQFGEALGVTRLTISLLERNKIAASPSVIRAAVDQMGVDEHWLRTGEKAKPVSKAEEIKEWLAAHPEDLIEIRKWMD